MKPFRLIAIVTLGACVSLPALAQRGHGRAVGRQGNMRQSMPRITPRPSENPPAENTRPFKFHYRGPGPHNGDWLRRYIQLSPEQQEKKLEQDKQFQELSPARQQLLRNRLNKFNSMSPDEKDRVLNRMEVFEHLTPAQQKRAQDLYGQFRSLDQERRKAVMQELWKMSDMSPEDREKTLNSDRLKNSYSEQERQLMKGLNNLGLVEHGPNDPNP